MILFLEGGVATAAKAGTTPELLLRAKREVAAWILASELGFRRLVPATVLRKMPASTRASASEVEGSAQLLWPRFSTALDKGLTARYCPDEVLWPIAVFDVLAANADRALGNWGVIEELPHVVLIDHGHAFGGGTSDSEFASRLKDELLSPKLLSAVQRFADNKESSRLHGLLQGNEVQMLFDRASEILKSKKLCV